MPPARAGAAVWCGHRAHALLPCLGDLVREVQRVDAWMMLFEVRPEPASEVAHQDGEAAVVQAGPALIQVANQQVSDGLALDPVGVYQFSRQTLPVAHRVPEGELFAKIGDLAQ